MSNADNQGCKGSRTVEEVVEPGGLVAEGVGCQPRNRARGRPWYPRSLDRAWCRCGFRKRLQPQKEKLSGSHRNDTSVYHLHTPSLTARRWSISNHTSLNSASMNQYQTAGRTASTKKKLTACDGVAR